MTTTREEKEHLMEQEPTVMLSDLCSCIYMSLGGAPRIFIVLFIRFVQHELSLSFCTNEEIFFSSFFFFNTWVKVFLKQFFRMDVKIVLQPSLTFFF